MRGEGRFAGDGLSAQHFVEVQKPSRLHALTGLRSFAALNIVFFHFSNPQWFGVFAPFVNSGFISVSFFLLLSGFILAYNYSERGERGEVSAVLFWKARLSRLYPVYLFSLVVSLGMLREEYYVRSHAMFAAGVVLTPILLQGWHPMLATFWNTPAWTMSTEGFFYIIFPWLITVRRPHTLGRILALLLVLWVLGMTPGALYMHYHPDGDMHPGRYTDGFWIRALKFTPLPHLPSFLFGFVLAGLHNRIPPDARRRLVFGLVGFAALYVVLLFGDKVPYALIHDGLLMPIFGMMILGLAGRNLLSRFFEFLPFVLLGEASYCMYILHFNLWILIHDSHLLDYLGVARFDPWLSYVLLVAGALATLWFIEKPGQRMMKRILR